MSLFRSNCTTSDIDKCVASGNINNRETMFGQSLLHILVRSNSVSIDYLLSKRPNVNIQDLEGRTPLFYANSVELTRKLIDAGSNMYIRDKYGVSAIEYNKHVLKAFSESIINKNIMSILKR